ncbi:MAG: hypothetical protein ACRDJN_24375 [Chloroflexota bacterium]
MRRQGWLASDDRAARAAAQQYGVPLSGTLGMLLLAVHQRLLSLGEANAILARMMTNGYYSPVATLDRLLKP